MGWSLDCEIVGIAIRLLKICRIVHQIGERMSQDRHMEELEYVNSAVAAWRCDNHQPCWLHYENGEGADVSP